MNICVERPKDPFIVTSKRKADALVLKDALKELDRNDFESFPYETPLEEKYEPIGGGTRKKTSQKTRFKNFVIRLGMAAVGGGFLIGPMWLMVLHNTPYTALISTSVCVFIFGVIMALVLEDLMNILSVTAAYAAVLVVFVGTNTVT
jgi:hypothetical protein